MRILLICPSTATVSSSMSTSDCHSQPPSSQQILAEIVLDIGSMAIPFFCRRRPRLNKAVSEQHRHGWTGT